MDITAQIRELASRAKQASRTLATASSDAKNAALAAMATALEANAAELKAANAQDLADGEKAGLSAALLDRLRLTDKRIAAMADEGILVAPPMGPVGQFRLVTHHNVSEEDTARVCTALKAILAN